MEDTKKTIALLISGLDDSYSEALCKGVASACKEEGYNLIVVPGAHVNREGAPGSEHEYAYQFNTMYRYINSQNVSGLVVAAASLGGYTTKEKMDEFLAGYKDIPMVLVSAVYEGYTCIKYDNTVGIIDGLNYLADNCGLTKFGVLRGPQGNPDAIERYQTFLKVMEEHNIPVEDKNVCDVDFSDDNHEACAAFLEANPDLEAVFCANDFSALDLCDEIKKAGKTPGDEIKVFGYDNVQQGAVAEPPLATVSADPVLLGHEAVSYLLMKIAGQDVQSVDLPATLIKRDTIGVSSRDYLPSMPPDAAFDYVFYHFRDNGYEMKKAEVEEKFTKYIAMLKTLTDYVDVTDDDIETADELLSELLDANAIHFADVDHFINYLEELQEDCLRHLETEAMVGLEDIYQNAFKKILKAVQREMLNKEDENRHKDDKMKHFVETTGGVHRAIDDDYCVLLSDLEFLHVRNGYIFILKRPMIHGPGQDFTPDNEFMLKAFLQDGSVWPVDPSMQTVPMDKIFHNDFTGGSRLTMVLLPLFVDKVLYGFVMLELRRRVYPHCKFLASQLSNSTLSIELMKKQKL
ncbi:MAG: substrate-binding domain-containing protein [Lachnospiraceae bacterium]|nr:substrate-binding domain-containing protein [Lachnospiraceae bacterium]